MVIFLVILLVWDSHVAKSNRETVYRESDAPIHGEKLISGATRKAIKSYIIYLIERTNIFLIFTVQMEQQNMDYMLA